jgi:DNA processing protein
MRNFITITSSALPQALLSIPNPPQTLYVEGDLDSLLTRPRVAIVGSRKASAYGRSVTAKLANELAKAGVVIVSGLALGVDSIAHKAALDAGGFTMAVLPTGLDTIYPSSHQSLARQIVAKGGALISEYPPNTKSFKQHFIMRNRLVSGISDVLLITEAETSSGTMHTAKFAAQQHKKIFAVPGDITNSGSAGTNELIKSGAQLVTSSADILAVLDIHPQQQLALQPTSDNPDELIILTLLSQGITEGGELLLRSKLQVVRFNHALTMLEINGSIRQAGAGHWALA